MSEQRKNVRPTLDDVALLAGVSKTTVSLVLSGKAERSRIAKESVERVHRAVEELKYTPNQVLRSVRNGRTQIASFYSAFRTRGANDLYLSTLTEALEYAAGQFGYDVLVHCNFGRTPLQTYQFFNGGWSDGVILFAPFQDDPLLPLLRESKLPTVLMGARDLEGVIPSVKEDTEGGMRIVAEQLLAKGHRKIAIYYRQNDYHRDAMERRLRLESELRAHGITVREEYLTDLEDERVALEQLMALPDPPTALFAWHDRLAYALLEHAERMKVRVPEDLSIVGYDGMVWPAASAHRADSIQVDLFDVALGAFELLDDVINNRPRDPRNLTVPVSYAPGTTLAAPRA